MKNIYNALLQRPVHTYCSYLLPLMNKKGTYLIIGVCILLFGSGDGDFLDFTMSNTLRQNSSKSSVSLSSNTSSHYSNIMQ